MDLIDRQAAIEILSLGKEILSRVLDDMDVVGTDREKYSWGLELIETNIKDIEELPSVQPVDKDINVPVKDCISRQMLLEYIYGEPVGKLLCDKYNLDGVIKQLPSAQPEQQHGRIFQEIVVEYPSISTYPEYKGKPYFSIKYTENGQEFIGYGTYKPEVLSECLKEYFMPYAQPKRTEKRAETHACDCISRQQAIDGADAIIARDTSGNNDVVKAMTAWKSYVEALPSAQPERLKGRWTDNNACPFCGFQPWYERDIHTLSYCPNCGADMRCEDDDIPIEYFENGGIYDKGR